MPWELFIPIIAISLIVVAIDIVFVMRDQPSARGFGTLAIAGVVAFPTAIVLHNALSAFIGGEEVVSFLIALLFAPLAVTAGALGVAWRLWPFRTARGVALGIGASAAGVGVFVLYGLFAMVTTAVTAGNPPYQAALEAIVLPLSATALAVGAMSAALGVWRDRRAARA